VLDPTTTRSITVEELARRLSDRSEVELLDVREPHEYALARIPGGKLIPLATLLAQLRDLERQRTYVVYCHTGVRSAHAVELMRRAGLRAINLAGGIDAWSARIDQSVPRY
jgi:adenylyltransferase/sulfurtransferase